MRIPRFRGLAMAAGLVAMLAAPPALAAPAFDPDRARLTAPDAFPRFGVPDDGTPVAQAGLDDGDYLAIVERGGQRRALLVKQLGFHHVAQGKLAGQPYMVSF